MNVAMEAPSTALRLQGLLDSLSREVEGIRAIVVGDGRGLPVASLVRGKKAMATTAMSTLLMSAAKNVVSSLELTEMKDLLVEGEGWIILLRSLGAGFTLLCLADETTNIGLLKLVADRRSAEVRELLEELR